MKMTTFLLGLAFLGLAVQPAMAAKLDKPVIIRYNPQTGAVEKLTLSKEIKSKAEAAALAENGRFEAVPNQHVVVSELDREAGVSSWFWHRPRYNYYYYPTYYYYGQTYYPYYTYNYNNCYYYYYSSAYSYGYNGWWR